MVRVLIASHNNGKLREYDELLNGMPVEFVLLDQVGITEDVPETGSTFEENAVLKANAYGEQSGMITLADDSGLEVAALGGAPGVYSARYAGEGASDQDRYRLLLKNLDNVPADQRQARFRCVIALRTPDGEIHTAEGIVEGMVGYEARGTHGFGYDPVFYLPEYSATLAELGPEIKNIISHRARALQAIMPALQEVIAQYQE
jgi:XTP/dITP diphosphohydrolase